jgi:phasin family protein
MAVDFPEIKTFSAASFEPFTKGLEAIAAETTDYSKKSLEKSQAFFEKLFGVKKIDEAIQLQSDFAKSAYDDFLAYATKIGETYSSLAKEAFKPINVASPAQSPVAAPPSKAKVAAKQD